MKTIPISRFKAQALKIIDQIAQNNDEMIITKRGKPLARILPYKETSSLAKPGQLADTLLFEEDIVSPLGEDIWETCS